MSPALDEAVACLRRGGVIAYPTESVYGLGCDPANPRAIEKLLKLKQRPADKGLILIAASLTQLEPWLEKLPAEKKTAVLASWPGPVTWLWPVRQDVSTLLRGRHATLAVRVTDHPLAAALCEAFGGPVVSTSANPSGEPPARTARQVRQQFDERLDFILEGEVGGRNKPSEIRDVLTGRVMRES